MIKFHSHPQYSGKHHWLGTCEKEKCPLMVALGLLSSTMGNMVWKEERKVHTAPPTNEQLYIPSVVCMTRTSNLHTGPVNMSRCVLSSLN